MATTTNLGITLPTVGADDDTWGTVNNNAIIAFDALYVAAGSGTSVGLKVGSGKTLNALDGTVILGDAGLTLKDTSDSTKIAAFQCSGITAGQTRTYTLPDASGTLLYSGGALGTPASGTLTSCTGLPISTGVSGLGTGVATLLGGASSGTGGPAGTVSPTLTGGVTIDGGGTAQPLALNSTAANGVYTRYTNSGTAIGYIGTPKQVISGGLSAADFAIAAAGGDLYLNGNSAIYAYIAGGAVGRFTSTGLNSTPIGASTPSTGAFTTLSATGLVDISGASAGQIKFPATQNASANANTLDDYEEGTVTLTDGSGAGLSLSGVNVEYTKIGNKVFINGNLNYPATADASTATLGSLPYTISNTDDVGGGSCRNSATAGPHTPIPIKNTTTFKFMVQTGNAANSTFSGAAVNFSLCYKTA